MLSLRLVISTAGFCAVRFHIDCELFNIFISRLVNAVMMSSLVGNWLGDLFVFAFSGKAKLGAASASNWIQFFCFCTALICICHTECGHLTGFYWSMVNAYFWWKVSEAPTVGIAPNDVDYYYAGFTLSGVWAACLKGLVMRCVAGDTNTLHFQSQALGEVNVEIVGARSVKTTVDYRAAKWLYIITIILTFLMCLAWTAIAWVVVEETGGSNVEWDKADADRESAETAKKHTNKVGAVTKGKQDALEWIVGIAFGGVLAVPGAMLGAGLVQLWEWFRKKPASKCTLIFWGIVGALGGFAAGFVPCVAAENWAQAAKKKGWVWNEKWDWPIGEAGQGETLKWELERAMKQMAPMMGLGAGLATGYLIGLIVACCKPDVNPYQPPAAGAFFGSFLGLISGEIYNGWATWLEDTDWEKIAIVVCGFMIVVLGLGTVYSIYPGMAPCSITQFQYFNIIDILILSLSSIAPLVIMGADLAGEGLGIAILMDKEGQKWAGVGFGVVFVIGTLVCEILVLSIMQHPHSKLAQQVTHSGCRAVLLTVTMVTSQLTSTGIGFACVAAGGGFNDGINNVLSTLTLWTIECTGVLGEGYLTELKKYEQGKWPTQGMDKWATYRWWNNKAFRNAWAIWCCIGTTDLRRDIMLCKQ